MKFQFWLSIIVTFSYIVRLDRQTSQLLVVEELLRELSPNVGSLATSPHALLRVDPGLWWEAASYQWQRHRALGNQAWLS